VGSERCPVSVPKTVTIGSLDDPEAARPIEQFGTPSGTSGNGKCTRAPVASAIDSAQLRTDSHQSTQPRLP